MQLIEEMQLRDSISFEAIAGASVSANACGRNACCAVRTSARARATCRSLGGLAVVRYRTSPHAQCTGTTYSALGTYCFTLYVPPLDIASGGV